MRRRSLSGQFVPQYFPVPYSSLGGTFVPAPGVVSSFDQPASLGGAVVESVWATPPLLPGLRQAPLGSAVPGVRALRYRGMSGPVDDAVQWAKDNPTMAMLVAAGVVLLFMGGGSTARRR
jgi:hypothetical protein